MYELENESATSTVGPTMRPWEMIVICNNVIIVICNKRGYSLDLTDRPTKDMQRWGRIEGNPNVMRCAVISALKKSHFSRKRYQPTDEPSHRDAPTHLKTLRGSSLRKHPRLVEGVEPSKQPINFIFTVKGHSRRPEKRFKIMMMAYLTSMAGNVQRSKKRWMWRRINLSKYKKVGDTLDLIHYFMRSRFYNVVAHGGI